VTSSRQSARLVGLALVVASLTIAIAASAGASGASKSGTARASNAQSPWPGDGWRPAAPAYGMAAEKDVPIHMDDGTILYANIGYPSDPKTGERATGPFPILLSQNPYSNDSTRPIEFFVSRGYIHAVADVRGAQRSSSADGGQVAWQFFSPRDAKDGVELVKWASRLDGSNGRVGLTGCSFLGINQIFTAAAIGPKSPIKAILPACASNGYYVYFVGGITSTVGTAFGPGVSTILGTRNADANAPLGASLGSDIAAGTGKAYNNRFWRTRTTANVVSKVAHNKIPALLWSGWNATEQPGPLEEYAILQNTWAGRPPYGPMTAHQRTTGRYQVVIGPGHHGEGLDRSIELEWFDTWLKRQPTGMNHTKTPMHLFEEGGTQRWVNASSYPVVDRYTRLHLGPDHALTRKPASESADTLKWGLPTETGTTLTYTSAPLERGATIAGPIAASIAASSSNQNLVLIATLNDVSPDGDASEISFGALLGSRRTLDRKRSWYDSKGAVVNPAHPYNRDVSVAAGTTLRYDIKLLPKVWSVAPGHSLQLVLSTRVAPEDCAFSLAQLPLPRPCVLNAVQQQTVPGGVYSIEYGGSKASTLNVPLLRPGVLHTARSRVTATSDGQTEPVDWDS
jgi:uncharacterized protein